MDIVVRKKKRRKRERIYKKLKRVRKRVNRRVGINNEGSDDSRKGVGHSTRNSAEAGKSLLW